MRLKILTVDDHEAAREGLKQLLIDTPIEIGWSLSDGDEAISILKKQRDVDAVLADVQMSPRDGLGLLSAIREFDRKCPVLMFSAFDNPTYVARSIALGADDYLLKSDSKETIVRGITAAAAGDGAATEGLFSRIRRVMRLEELPAEFPASVPLTNREVQVFRHIGLGLSNREIAQSLDISVETVKEHVQNMLRKINANDRTAAAVQAVRMGLVDY